MKHLFGTWKDERGIARIVVLMAILVALLIAVAVLPYLRKRADKAVAEACALTLASANDDLLTDFILSGGAEYDAAKVREVRPDYDQLCPAGGVIRITYDERGVPILVCQKHGS